MKSLLQKFYHENDYQLFNDEKEKTNISFVESLIEKGIILYIDYSCSKYLLDKICKTDDDDILLAVIYQFYCSRLGHLCIYSSEDSLKPHPNDLFIKSVLGDCDEAYLHPDDLIRITDMIRNGFLKLPSEIVKEIKYDKLKTSFKPICRWNNFYYLQRNWAYESLVIHYLKQHVHAFPKVTIEESLIEKELTKRLDDNQLLDLQALAIKKALTKTFTIITGGPGTGKTYTAYQLIYIYLKYVDPKFSKIILAAPTGKATANLGSILSLIDKENQASIQFKTLHSLLKYAQDQRYYFISADLILVDESSMMDVKMLAVLLKSIKPGTRIIFLGDRNQLPPIESGSLFADLTKGIIHQNIIELKQCIRTDLEEIVNLANFIKKDDSDLVIKSLSSTDPMSVTRKIPWPKDCKTSNDRKKIVLSYAKNYFPTHLDLSYSHRELLNSFQSFCLLSPLRKGPLGVDSINKEMKQYFESMIDSKNIFIAPIMITQNDYPTELFNGDLGVLISFNDIQRDFAIFESRHNEQSFFEVKEQVRKIPSVMLPTFQYAYCISVHKSQGSEYKHVLLLLPDIADLFGKELLYTALTRAKERFEIFTDNRTLKKIIGTNNHRLSGIAQRLGNTL